ncbi:MAG: DUF6444 domain-containing protein [Planctomycetaceae bacterium]
MNSGNSSPPPSSDRPGQQPVSTAKPRSKRKRGGQAGHVRRTRELIPTEHQIHTLQCPNCHQGGLPQQTCTQTDPAKLLLGAP